MKFLYDVFISHAVEDKQGIATGLAQLLEKKGLKVWYSGKDLNIGDRVESTISKGLHRSRFGVAILSPDYLKKDWTIREFHALRAREYKGEKVILPVLHKVTIDDLKAKDISMADTFGISSTRGVDEIAEVIIAEINERKATRYLVRSGVWKSVIPLLSVIILLLLMGYAFFSQDIPDDALINTAIRERIENLETRINSQHLMEMHNTKGDTASRKQIIRVDTRFNELDSRYRNKYEFLNGFQEIQFRKNVEKVLRINIDLLTPFNTYGMKDPTLFLYYNRSQGASVAAKYALFNTQKARFEIVGVKSEGSRYLVQVVYSNNIRSIDVVMHYSEDSGWLKMRSMTFKGFLPEETYIFEKSKEEWRMSGITQIP